MLMFSISTLLRLAGQFAFETLPDAGVNSLLLKK